MPTFKDITGQRFGSLTVIARVPRDRPRSDVCWECLCDCGRTRIVALSGLKRRKSEQCACSWRVTHGHCGQDASRPGRSSEYTTWAGMKGRCYYPTCTAYRNYGARGIRMSERWRNSFAAFFADMGRKPSPQHSIDRIDPDGDYTLENCRWATPEEQRASKRPRKKKSA